jgi:lipopolysaccharide export system permease protein
MGGIGRIDPAVAQWVPFLLFAALCVWFYHVLAHRPGGQPIGGLDRGFAILMSVFRRFRRKKAAA